MIPRRAALAALGPILLLAGVLGWRLETSVDFGFHLASGRWILRHGGWPVTDPFTYTVPDHAYIDMHGLFQIGLALIHDAFGMLGVGLLRLALVVGAISVVFAGTVRRGVRSAPLLLAGFTAGILACEPRFFMRPELCTYLFFAVTLYLLQRHTDEGRSLWLYLCVPLQVVWTYSHALSLFGPALLGLYALVGLLDKRRRGRAIWIALGLSLLALCVNPYGLRGVAFLLRLGGHLRSGEVFAESIGELLSPFAVQAPSGWPFLAFVVLLGATLITTLLCARSMRAFDLALVVVFAGLAAVAMRNIPLFVVATLPPFLANMQRLIGTRTPRWATPLGLLVILLLALNVVTGAYYLANRRPHAFGYGLSRATYPVRTTDLLVDLEIPGPIYNHLAFGGYLIQRLWPRERVFIDGRLDVMGRAFFEESELINNGTRWAAMMERYDPNVVLIPHRGRQRVARLQRDPQWVLLDVDGAGALFMRNRSGNAGLIEQAHERRRTLRQQAAATGSIEPRRDRSWIVRWLGTRRFPFEAFGRTNALGDLGLHAEAYDEARRALKLAGRDYAPLAANYAEACFRTGRTDEARIWYRRTVELEPDYPGARERVTTLEER